MPRARSGRSHAGSRGGQPHQDVLRLAQLLERPVTDAAAVGQMLTDVEGTCQRIVDLATKPGAWPYPCSSTSSQVAAQLSSCVATALQCAGWLVAARQAHQLSTDDLLPALGQCVSLSQMFMSMVSGIGPDLLQAALQPSGAGHAPGLTTWLPLAAGVLLSSAAAPPDSPSQLDSSSSSSSSSPAPSSPQAAAATRSSSRSRSLLQEGLLVVWDTFFSAWLNACFFSSSSRSDKPSSRGSLVGAAAWLQPSVQQLADKLLQRPLVSTTPALVLRAMMCGVLTGTGGPIPHPRLAAAAGLPPDPALAAQVAAAVQQDSWWRVLATIVGAVTETTTAKAAAALPAYLPQHPSRFCPPYHLEQAYAGQFFNTLPGHVLAPTTHLALHVLLVAQLWEVWPWQLQQLQQDAARDEHLGPSTAAAAGIATSAASSCGVAGADGDATLCVVQHSDGSSGRSSNRNSSSSSRGATSVQQVSPPSFLRSTRLPPDHTAWETVLRSICIDWLLLLDQGQGDTQQHEGQGPPPVTLLQLQLAVSALAHGDDAEGAVSAALLLALLLQRADPGLRASFLAGPGGTALLAAAQYWCTAAMEPGGRCMLFFALCHPVLWEDSSCAARMLAALQSGQSEETAGWKAKTPYGSLARLLAWCYLAPVGGWELQVPAAWGPAPMWPYLVATLHHVRSLQQAQCVAHMPECLAVMSLPCEALHFAPGCAPTPLLLGTLEALLRASKPAHGLRLLCDVAAFVNATLVWMNGAPVDGSDRAAPVGQCVSGTGGSSSSSRILCAGAKDAVLISASSPDAAEPCNTVAGSSSSSSQPNIDKPDCHGSSNGATNSACAVDNADLLASLASLAVTIGHSMNCWGIPLSNHDSDSQRLRALPQCVVPSCCLVAAQLLHLAAQQLQTPGPSVLPALQLAAAAQCLAGNCGALAESTTAALKEASDPQLETSLDCMDPALHIVLAAAAALRKAQPSSWQSGEAHTPGSQQKAAADMGEAEVVKSSSSSSSGGGGGGNPFQRCDKSDLLLSMATSIQRLCRPRLQLVGCSHPRCTNLSGPSAQGLVAGHKGVVCSGCRVARYCSPACQKADWPQHRHVCRRLAVLCAH